MAEPLGSPPGWPRPPFDWPHLEPQEPAGAHACHIDTIDNRWLQAFALEVDPGAREWRVAAKASGPFVLLPLARVARITLSAPLQAAVRSLEDGLARIPVSTLGCDYTLQTPTGRTVLRGRTVGHVDTDDGVFLFSALAGEPALNRIFVPRAAQLSCTFGPAAAGPASPAWIKDPSALRVALSSQRSRRIPRMGEALEQLGFVTAQQVDQALAEPDQRGRLGERLVEQGLLKPEQLQTALAFKLGYPLVDLARFPIDPACARMLPADMASRHCAVPILLDGRHVVVAVDGPATAATIEALNLWPGRIITPALAPRGAILLALSALRGDDAWAQEAPWR